MKQREYFEQLVAAELDGELSPEQRAELDRQLTVDPELRAFRADLVKQQLMLQSLPHLPAMEQPGLARQSLKSEPAMVRLWRSRVTLSAPLASAAAILLFVAGLLVAGLSSQPERSPQQIVHKSNIVLYESEQLAPATSRPITTDEFELN